MEMKESGEKAKERTGNKILVLEKKNLVKKSVQQKPFFDTTAQKLNSSPERTQPRCGAGS